MTDIPQAEAITRARNVLGLGEALPARAWHVRRLDRPEDAYFLVVVGEGSAEAGIAVVGAAVGEIRTSARLANGQPPVVMDIAEVRKLAGQEAGEDAELVWRPCAASRSPLYPFWKLGSPPDELYVDQQGRVWKTLDSGGRGGGGIAEKR